MIGRDLISLHNILSDNWPKMHRRIKFNNYSATANEK